jgi:ATP-dependent DNA helicase DinG
VSTGAGFSLYQFFAPGGVLSKTHSAYEFRRGQLQMAQAVEQAIDEKRHLIVEAGTGTGKTLAYLLPAIRSGKRVIISTNTKNLQEQLFFKDVPFLEQALLGKGAGEGGEKQIPRFARSDNPKEDDAGGDRKSYAARNEHPASKLSVCYMKGRNNYLCRKKLYDLTDQPVLSGLLRPGRRRHIPATAPNWANCPRQARFGTRWTRARTPA